MAGLFERRVQIETNGINMAISQLAYVNIADWWHIKTAKTPYAKMFFVEKGEGEAELHYNGKTVYLKPGNIYIVPPYLEHGYSCKGNFDKLFCNFNLFRYDHYDLFSAFKDIVVLENRENTVTEVIKCYHDRNIIDCLKLKTLMYSAAYDALLLSGAATDNIVKYSPIIYKTIELINGRCRIDLKADTIAEELFVSAATLQKQFKREVGASLGKYIKTWVMLSSEFELRTTKLPIKELAEKYGFCDQFYFSRVFSNYFHISPLKYRNSHKEEYKGKNL